MSIYEIPVHDSWIRTLKEGKKNFWLTSYNVRYMVGDTVVFRELLNPDYIRANHGEHLTGTGRAVMAEITFIEKNEHYQIDCDRTSLKQRRAGIRRYKKIDGIIFGFKLLPMNGDKKQEEDA